VKTTDPLARVKRAAEARRRAEEEFRAALQAARDAGHSGAKIAQQVGENFTRQAVLKATVAPTGPSREAMEARLAELDARWDALVGKVAEVERPPDSYVKRETAKRNSRRGVESRRGLPPRATVLAETRVHAERKLLCTLRDHPEDSRVVAIVAEIVEAGAIRERLEASFDRSLGIA
jgi:hypothetical protein